jgi:hypothetical protein
VIDVRVAALETAAALEHVIDPAQLGFDLAHVLADPDPLLRVAALELVPRPTAPALRASIVPVLGAGDAAVTLAAARTLCADAAEDLAAVKAALGPEGLARIKAIVKAHPDASASRCLK